MRLSEIDLGRTGEDTQTDVDRRLAGDRLYGPGGFALTDEELASFHRDGFVVLCDVIPHEVLERVRQTVTTAVEDFVRPWRPLSSVAEMPSEVPFERRHVALCRQLPVPFPTVWRRRLVSEAVYQLWQRPELLGPIRSLLGDEVYAHGVWHARSLPPRHPWQPVYWHRDALDYPDWQPTDGTLVSVWFPLVPVNEHSGCLQLVPGSHTANVVDVRRKNGKTSFTAGLAHEGPNSQPPCSVVTELGDAVIYAATTLHQQLDNLEDHMSWTMDIRFGQATEQLIHKTSHGYRCFSASDPAGVETYRQWAASYTTIDHEERDRTLTTTPDAGPTFRFPDGFLWGAATASHQVEGGNRNNDWWAWEHAPDTPCKEPSGDACDSWHRWPEDVELVSGMGLGTYRFSLEWSRIEPEEGEWSKAAVAHYRAICEALLERGIEPTVTLHHFTNPRWLADQGSWENPATADRFARFCERIAGELGDVLGRVCTINEPNVVALVGWRQGIFPPGKVDGKLRHQVNEVFVDAHRKAVDAIRSAAPGVPVGLTLAMSDAQAVDGGEATLERLRRGMEDVYLDAVAGDDFVGVQTYSRVRIGPDGPVGPESGVPVVDGFPNSEYWPQALEATLRRAWSYTGGSVPLMVTENGLSSQDDQRRVAYLQTALEGVAHCLAEGIDVRGYICWTLLDNFEWFHGYGPRMGLVEVDRDTFVRTPKPSAKWFGNVARTNTLTLPAAARLA